MKYYMASFNGEVSDGMNYKEQGSGNDLYLHFPELREIINRYPFKTIDFRLTNGDRLRIYDINKNKSLNIWERNNKYRPKITEEESNEKRTLINSWNGRTIKLQHPHGSAFDRRTNYWSLQAQKLNPGGIFLPAGIYSDHYRRLSGKERPGWI